MRTAHVTCLSLALGGLVMVATSAAAEPERGGLRFSRTALCFDLNECCDVADVNQDGQLDVIAGRNWYCGTDLVPRALRIIDDWSGYAQNSGEHAIDVNGDGWVDVLAVGFTIPEICWYENPGPEGLKRGWLWKRHVLVDSKGEQNEGCYLRDLDGDGVPELIVNSWNPTSPLIAWQLSKDESGTPTLIRHELAPEGNSHGMGFGDINGDGREDILVGTGWFEQPAAGPFSGPWRSRTEWTIPQASCPMIVTDLDGDGRNDIIRGMAHGYGLFWRRQLEPLADGTTQWEEHLIDDSWSQPHCLLWADLDGDGQKELITGKRIYAHNGSDPGADEPPCLYYYKWNRAKSEFTRYTIDHGHAGGGLQIRLGDINGDGRLDVVVAGKSGTYVLHNEGVEQ
jgi:hypothetical protein